MKNVLSESSERGAVAPFESLTCDQVMKTEALIKRLVTLLLESESLVAEEVENN